MTVVVFVVTKLSFQKVWSAAVTVAADGGFQIVALNFKLAFYETQRIFSLHFLGKVMV